MNTQAKNEIYAALVLLEEAAKDTAVELWTVIKDQFPNLQQMLLDNVDHVRESVDSIGDRARAKANQIRQAGQKKVRDAVSQVDGEVHHHPWYYIGSAAVSFLLLGFILGRKSGS